MKKIIRTLFAFAAVGLLATSCQKESFVEPNSDVQQSVTQCGGYYTIDGNTYAICVGSDSEWTAFVIQMVNLAEEGHTVTFSRHKASIDVAKEVVTYSTANKQEAYDWAANMTLQGYEVTVSFDNNTGMFNCTAVRK